MGEICHPKDLVGFLPASGVGRWALAPVWIRTVIILGGYFFVNVKYRANLEALLQCCETPD